jgi:4-hydroxy-3-polyprenylbenzoate decarboxylase
MKQRLVVGISGGSGMPIALELLRQLKENPSVETHLMYTRGAEITLQQETDVTVEELNTLADVVYDNSNIGAGPASGTFKTIGMVVVPCSMKTVAGICSGYSDNLLLRAADVTLKERRRLVLVARECPLSTIHLRNMLELSQMGVEIMPPMLTYYNHPKTLDDCTRHIVGKILDRFGIEGQCFNRWEGMDE